jgi:transposase InsO family protein
MLTAIVSDRDKIFTSTFWQTLFRLDGTELRLSTAYHPQTDGQTERLNQCMETYLRCFVHACPSKWIHWLPLAEFWYNSTFHSALGRTPFEVLYDYALVSWVCLLKLLELMFLSLTTGFQSGH